MTIFVSAQNSVARSLKRNGQLGAIRRTTVTGGGPSSLSGGTQTVTDYPCQLALFPIGQRDVVGELVKAGDWRVIVQATAPGGEWTPQDQLALITDIVPTTTDVLVCSEGDLRIVDPGKFSPAGTTTHYDMIARKA